MLARGFPAHALEEPAEIGRVLETELGRYLGNLKSRCLDQLPRLGKEARVDHRERGMPQRALHGGVEAVDADAEIAGVIGNAPAGAHLLLHKMEKIAHHSSRCGLGGRRYQLGGAPEQDDDDRQLMAHHFLGPGAIVAQFGFHDRNQRREPARHLALDARAQLRALGKTADIVGDIAGQGDLAQRRIGNRQPRAARSGKKGQPRRRPGRHPDEGRGLQRGRFILIGDFAGARNQHEDAVAPPQQRPLCRIERRGDRLAFDLLGEVEFLAGGDVGGCRTHQRGSNCVKSTSFSRKSLF